MCIFNLTSRTTLISELTAAMRGFDNEELTEIAENALAKLEIMDDDEFTALALYPEYEAYDEGEE
jgi:hypothetical protein